MKNHPTPIKIFESCKKEPIKANKNGKPIRKSKRVKPEMKCEHTDRRHYSHGLC